MRTTLDRMGRLAAVGLLATAVLAASTACGGLGSGGSNEKVTLVVDTFSKFGFEDLYKQYEAAHPNITIKSRVSGGLDDYWPKLTQFLAAGSGAGDVVALEEAIMPYYKGHSNSFVDLADYGANAMKADFLPWKWAQGTDADGGVMALGTDIGGLAMCYRADLFAEAGLPTDRDSVSKLWGTWAGYRATGLRFKAARTGAAFIDSSVQTFNASLIQAAGAAGNVTYLDEQNKLIIDTNPAVRTAWNTAMGIISAGLTAKVAPWSDAWNKGFKNGSFATIACPSWMLGIIESASGPANKGKWDVAAMPGGGGNWGGSFLAVPVQSKHQAEAAELAMFLTSPASHVVAFKAVNALPSDVRSLNDPAFLALTNPYFSNAPVGKIFGAGAKALKPVFLGLKNQAIREQIVEPAILAVENNTVSPAVAWRQTVAAARKKV